MRNMLAFLAAVVVTVAAVGWYLDWYKVGTAPGTAGHKNVVVDINTVKIGHDIHKASEKGEKWVAEHNKKSAPTPATKADTAKSTATDPIPVGEPDLFGQR